jgi:hypothetical protein
MEMKRNALGDVKNVAIATEIFSILRTAKTLGEVAKINSFVTMYGYPDSGIKSL